MKRTYPGSCHCGAVRFEADVDLSHGLDPKGEKSYAVRVNCLEGVDENDLVDAPIRYFDMRHDNFKSPPAETRYL